ncbi:hypothetical protein [Geothrix fuzhouensis]|uniref:hypothetical protein n=1 Tax=Geothrix fuzhouensis TaxID=2966451 RepID=UPI00214773C8|nr:hypothetical protein [Geothrix fuzhouensis]
MDISHKFSFSDLYEKAKNTLLEAGLPFTADVMWPQGKGPWLLFVQPSELSKSQHIAIKQLETLIQEDTQRLAEWKKSNS